MDGQDTKGVETLPSISTSRVGRTNVTDDRRPTDGRQHYSEREFTLAKNCDEVTASVHSETYFLIVGWRTVRFFLYHSVDQKREQ